MHLQPGVRKFSVPSRSSENCFQQIAFLPYSTTLSVFFLPVLLESTFGVRETDSLGASRLPQELPRSLDSPRLIVP